MKSSQIRQEFLKFFSNKNHQIVASAPIVLKDDPTLMFTNAGMNQFKDYFIGTKQHSHQRVADTQKCLRVSGKHNDLEEVGHDTYHHTMFEMLGNWSFGDYFKQEAIDWAWELLTEVYQIPKENLYVSVFAGDTNDQLPKDQEAYDIWKQHLPEERILAFDKKDNFWEMGETGPCGPCSEIHVDIRSAQEKAKTPGNELVNKDHPQVIEVWNLVFMEFFRKANGNLEPLKEKHIDTGMGFERLAMVLQGKQSNYDTDVFAPIIQQIEKKANYNYGSNAEQDIAVRVIADHLRAVAFAIADGQLPSNNGAGYVIRRILRRAISYAYRFLNINEPFIFELVDVLDQEMGDVFSEIRTQKQLVTNVLKEEENSFLKTLSLGLNRISHIIKQNQKQGKTAIDGKVIFELYDTYGFPVDLSELVAKKDGMSIDLEGFELEMNLQKNRARQATTTQAGDWIVVQSNCSQGFVGYDQTKAKVKINQYRITKTPKGQIIQVVLNQTPFYAESGGQVGDTGVLQSDHESIVVTDTKKENDLVVHTLAQLPKKTDTEFMAIVDSSRRDAITKNHTATHLLHQALRTILGTHVEQKGSYVGPDRLRFDFSHFSKLSDKELEEIENLVNQNIQKGLSLQEERKTTIEQAKAKGAMALFGEKYGDWVRTIQFGESIELCGGCHVNNTKDILYFKIESESSIAAGVRRLEATTANTAIDQLKNISQQFNQIAELLNKPKDPIKNIELLLDENQQLKKQIEHFTNQQAQQEKLEWKQNLQPINGIQFLAVKTDLDANAVKQICFQLKSELNNILLVVGSTAQQKPTITVLVSDSLTQQYNASNMVRDLAKEIKGGGGGQPFFATAGGKDINGIDAALAKAKQLIQA